MDQDMKRMQRDFGEVLGLRDTEAQTMAAIVKECARTYGMVLGTTGAVGMAGAGSVLVPGIGAVPGWLAGFAGGFVGGTLMCTVARRGAVIEALKRSMSDARGGRVSDTQAMSALREELFRLSAHRQRSA